MLANNVIFISFHSPKMQPLAALSVIRKCLTSEKCVGC